MSTWEEIIKEGRKNNAVSISQSHECPLCQRPLSVSAYINSTTLGMTHVDCMLDMVDKQQETIEWGAKLILQKVSEKIDELIEEKLKKLK
jgi:hypothetical protein